MFSWKYISKEDSGNQWTLGEPENVVLYDFWDFCKADSLDCGGDIIIGKDQCIDLDSALCLIMGESMWKNHRIVFNEHVIYVNNDIQKH